MEKTITMTLNEIRKVGFQALVNSLGAVNAARFLQQFDLGKGDYTKEREKLLAGITLQAAMKEIEDMKRSK